MIKSLSLTSRNAIGALALTIAGCAAINQPINKPITAGQSSSSDDTSFIPENLDGSVYIGLAFSGGGTRASAFAHGMLTELQATSRSKSNPDGLLKHVRLVTGVSGGSVTAAYYGLRGPKGLSTYRDGYLIKDGEKYMSTSAFNPITLSKGISGGVNSRDTFARFMDETIFHGATYKELLKNRDIQTWINASDIATNAPFLFTPETFDALCSDLSQLPISEAVAASAAVPLVFSPIVLKSHQGCKYTEPDWLVAARHNPESTSAMRAYAQALESYRDPAKVRYVKLLDGAVTDNFGTTGLSVARAKAKNSYGPLTERQAVQIKRMLFLVADAGTQKDYQLTQNIKGPGGLQLAQSIASSATGAATRVGYDVMRLTLRNWHADLIDFRCGLSPDQVVRLRGNSDGWDCADVKLFVGDISFADLDADMRSQLNDIPTRLTLPAQQVDLAILAGRESTRRSSEFNGFLKSLKESATVVSPNARRITPIKN